jgi:hypothetical protein
VPFRPEEAVIALLGIDPSTFKPRASAEGVNLLGSVVTALGRPRARHDCEAGAADLHSQFRSASGNGSRSGAKDAPPGDFDGFLRDV